MSKISLTTVKTDLNWSEKASKYLGTFLLTRMSPNIFEINADNTNENKMLSVTFMRLFLVMFKKNLWDQ